MAKIKYINREISWLSFNARVLQEAKDERVPLLERIVFLGIVSSNLDEFFRVRVATIRRLAELGKKGKGGYGEDPAKILEKIYATVRNQQEDFEATYRAVFNQLEKNQIFIKNEKELSSWQGEFVKEYFEQKVKPAIGPVMLSYTPDFPRLSDEAIYLAVELSKKKQEPVFALIEIPTRVTSRFLVLPATGDGYDIILLDDIIRYCLKDLFVTLDFDTAEAYTLKITRDAELDIDNDISKSFLEKISKSLQQRKQGDPVRFVYDEEMPQELKDYLVKKLKLDNHDSLIPGGRYHNFRDFMKFPKVGPKSLQYNRPQPLPHPHLEKHNSLIKAISKQDVLLHFPFQSFNYIINLIREAAIDPLVTEIKMTIYRLADSSQIADALINAVKNGKKVTAVVELRARFDERANIKWTSKLKEEGVKVIFGIPGLKCHSKLILINRREGEELVSYANVATGNFNESTAKLYCDHALLTADPRITKEVRKVFSFIEDPYRPYQFEHLLVSPLFMREQMNDMIDQEIENAENGKEAYIIVKLNNLVDLDVVERLYRASDAGVKVKMIVRGVCSLIPGEEGISENIQGGSIVDKYLEHSRIFVFANDGDERYYLSSADWMARNLDHRVEVATPIYDKSIRKELKKLLDIQFKDNVKYRILDGKLKNEYKVGKGEEFNSQEATYDWLASKVR